MLRRRTCRRRQRARRAAPGRGARHGRPRRARPAADGARGRAGVRPQRDRGDDGRARRCVCRSAHFRWTAPTRAAPPRTRSATSPSSSRSGMPRVCIQCGNCSFVCPHSVIRSQLLRRVPAGGGAGAVRFGAARRRRPARTPATRCRSTSRTARDAACVSRPARSSTPGDHHHARRSTSLRRARWSAAERENITFFETLPVDRPIAGGLRHGARHPVPGAAVRVLRRMCGLRRDALSEAALAAVRRPADDRQRDRLLLHLRRQPADDAVDHRRRRAGAGLVELAVRGQRGVRARLPAGRRRARRAGPPAARRVTRRPRPRARRRHPGGAAAAGVGVARPAGAGGRAAASPRRPRCRRCR